MADIVERLRDSDTTRRIGESYADVHDRRQADRDEAADTITRLRAEVEKLRGQAEFEKKCRNDAFDELKKQDAEITRLRNELHIAQEWSARVIAGHEQDITEITALRAENERLQEALRPFAGMFLYPDDLGYEASSDIKEDLDWDDDANDMNTENVFVLRRDIRRARAVLSASQPAPSALPVLSDEFVRAEMDAMQARENKRLETLFTQPAPQKENTNDKG